MLCGVPQAKVAGHQSIIADDDCTSVQSDQIVQEDDVDFSGALKHSLVITRVYKCSRRYSDKHRADIGPVSL
jgi:hypothetical protein